MKEHGKFYYWVYNNVWWYIKQLVPCLYTSETTDEDGRPILVIWRMWFGKVFRERKYLLAR